MKKYERDLKKLIDLSNNGCDLIHQQDCGMNESNLRLLAAKGLISLVPAGDDEFWVSVEGFGLTYFSNKSEARAAAVKNRTIGFVLGVITSVVAGVILQWLEG